MVFTAPVGLIRNADGFDEVAARIKPSAAALWDVPGGSLVEVMDDWVECKFGKHHGFVKTKNLPGVEAQASGAMCEVKDSYPGNSETCMRRHAEQDATIGNVLCYVPNGLDQVELVDRWVEFRWKKHKGFVKARHVTEAPEGAEAAKAAPAQDAGADAPMKRGGAAPEAAGAPAAKKARAGPGAAASSGDDVPCPMPGRTPPPRPPRCQLSLRRLRSPPSLREPRRRQQPRKPLQQQSRQHRRRWRQQQRRHRWRLQRRRLRHRPLLARK